MTNSQPGPNLQRKIGLSLLLLYGLGNILGAGIYVLIGKVAGVAGYQAPLAFFLASLGVAFTVFSYAELAARYPVSAGVAIYLYQAFAQRWLSRLVGLLVMISGITSTAAISRGFVGYMQVLWPQPELPLLLGLILCLGGIAAWGIGESVRVVAVFTLLEAAGLLLIAFFGGLFVLDGNGPADLASELLTPNKGFSYSGVWLGAFLALYAFLGFEDMVNIAEEVKQPQRNLPLAALLALLLATLLYAAISWVAAAVVSPAELAQSDAPLALIYQRSTGQAPTLIVLISLFAVVNGALIQLIMSSRMLFGMSRQGWLPVWFARVHPRTATPLRATAIVVVLMMLFALALPLQELAELTSFLILVIFVLVNLSLIVIKRRQPFAEGVQCYPGWVPVCGLLVSVSFIAARLLLA